MLAGCVLIANKLFKLYYIRCINIYIYIQVRDVTCSPSLAKCGLAFVDDCLGLDFNMPVGVHNILDQLECVDAIVTRMAMMRNITLLLKHYFCFAYSKRKQYHVYLL